MPFVVSQSGGQVAFNGGTITGALTVDNFVDVLPAGGGEVFFGASGYTIQIPAAKGADIEDHNGSSLLFVDEASRVIVFGVANAAPDTALMSAGLFGLWLDPTPGATKLMVKALDQNAAVRTAAIALT